MRHGIISPTKEVSVMKGLVLYGMNCQLWIWDELKARCGDLDLTYLEYPHALTLKSQNVHDLSVGVFKAAFSKGQAYDVIIGHSMGGNIALELSARPDVKTALTLIIETSIRASGAFYHNLLTEKNQMLYGAKVEQMLAQERPFYSSKLLGSFRKPFDFGETLGAIDHRVVAIYGDRGQPDYPHLVSDLNLTPQELQKLEIGFIQRSCHLPMLENPDQLSAILHQIFASVSRSIADQR